MVISIVLAKIFGIYLLVTSLAVLSRQKPMMQLVREFISNKPLVFVVASAELILGLLTIINHNIWVNDWRAIITIAGWLMVIEGALYILLPAKTTKEIVSVFNNKNFYLIGGLAAFVLGIYLTYVGFYTV